MIICNGINLKSYDVKMPSSILSYDDDFYVRIKATKLGLNHKKIRNFNFG